MANEKYSCQMRSASKKAVFCHSLPRFAGQKKLLIICDSVTEKAKYGKMRQVNAVNGSQMVVKLRGSYYRRVWDSAVGEVEMFMLIVLRTLFYSQNQLKRPAHQHVENQQSCCSYPFSNQKLYSLPQPISIPSPTPVL